MMLIDSQCFLCCVHVFCDKCWFFATLKINFQLLIFKIKITVGCNGTLTIILFCVSCKLILDQMCHIPIYLFEIGWKLTICIFFILIHHTLRVFYFYFICVIKLYMLINIKVVSFFHIYTTFISIDCHIDMSFELYFR